MARAYVILPDGWGPSRLAITHLERAGYQTEHWIILGRGQYVILR